ncbi:MAG: hypothetical protein NVSMB22_17730 [Chloroflexota bacterium]
MHAKLSEYHHALTAESASNATLQTELSNYVTAVQDRDRERERLVGALGKANDHIGWLEDLREIADSKRWAKRARYLGPLSQQDADRLRVLFVADRDDAPYRYRCVHACEQLRSSNVTANILRLDDPGLLAALPYYSVVVLFRLGWSDQVERVAAEARRSGATVAFDIDDLIFDPEVERLMPFLRDYPVERVASYRRDFAKLAQTLGKIDFCIAATPAIARHARRRGARTLVHPNLLSEDYVRLSRPIALLRMRLLREPLLAYFSGSNTHDRDLASIEEPLKRVLDASPKARLVICGHAALPSSLTRLRDRVLILPYQDYRVYPWLMARCATVLAPIEDINDFSNAKSALKVFEAGVFGVPAIASSTIQYQDAIMDGVSGIIASTPSEWEAALLRLCQREESLTMGAQARRIALDEYSPAAYQHALARQLLGLCGVAAETQRPPGRALDKTGGAMHAVRLARRALDLAIGKNVQHTADSPISLAIPDSEGAEAADWVAVAEHDQQTLRIQGRTIGSILANRTRPISRWTSNCARELPALSPGCRFEALSDDPSFVLDMPVSFHGSAPSLLVEMRARTDDGFAHAQLFWKASAAAFDEARSVRFRVVADDEPHRYLVPLNKRAVPLLPPHCEALRFDPLDRSGEFEITLIAALSETLPSHRPALRNNLAERFLVGDGIEIGALHNPLPVSSAAHVRYVDRLSLADLRRHYPELADAPVVDPSIIATADDLSPVSSGSQQFVICNHVLEHMRDPLGALREWLRVLAPDGILYVSIPGRDNPHDRRRPITTFEHLLEDEKGRGRKGTAVDRESFREWAHSAHAADMTEAQRDTHSEHLIAIDYSIHFHVFDRALFERVLEVACTAAGAHVEELLDAPLEGYRESIAIIRKNSDHLRRRPVDVVVPIFNARDLTRRCVDSVLEHMTGDGARLVLIDDASTDEGLFAELTARAKNDARVVVLRNVENLGFVKTANRGFRHAEGRDVLLLNSDTEVFHGFLDQLRDAAYVDEATGIVTPFSNNATIFSIPEFGDNPIPEGYTPASFARLVSSVSRRLRPEMPTAVGYCMYLRANALKKVGLFDEDTFGRGFGEENDLCQRARAAGFKVRLCDDAFVWHKGKASFGEIGRELERNNETLLQLKHPQYAPEIAHFCRTNPLEGLHREIKFHIPRLRKGATGAALFLLHSSPFASSIGGTEHHVLDLVRSLKQPRVVIGYPEGATLVAAEVLNGRVDMPSFFRFAVTPPADRFCIEHSEVQAEVRRWIDLFGIRWAHLHHLMFWPVALGGTLSEANVPYVLTAHDYYAACPSWNLFDVERNARCPCPSTGNESSEGCVPAVLAQCGYSAPTHSALLRQRHRSAWSQTLRGACAVITPSVAAREVLRQHIDSTEVSFEVIEHGYDAGLPARRKDGGHLVRLGILGEVAYPLKGARRYLELLHETKALPLEWHVFGDVERFGFADELRRVGLGDRLHLHGPYNRAQIVDLIATEGIELSVNLPEWDETFSYTLSESILAGVPSLVLDRGALAERVLSDGIGFVVSSVADATGLLHTVCADRSVLASVTERARKFRHRSVEENALIHRKLYERLGLFETLDAEVRPEWLHELAERAGVYPSSPIASAPVPGLGFTPHGRRLRAAIELIRPFVPPKIRKLGKAVLGRLSSRPSLVLKTERAPQMTGLRLIKKSGSTATYEAQTTDPQLHFRVGQLFTSKVNEVRFRLRRERNGVAHAQLFWAGEGHDGFSEDRSALILLSGVAGEWREYSLRLDSTDLASRWRCGAVAHLRFDPIDQPGVIEIGRLEFRA